MRKKREIRIRNYEKTLLKINHQIERSKSPEFKRELERKKLFIIKILNEL